MGAEAEKEGVEQRVEDEGWMRAEWYVELLYQAVGRDLLLYHPLQGLSFTSALTI